MSAERGWLQESSLLFSSAVDRLADGQFAEPSLLPGWTRGHVVAHVHLNAEALRRLLAWARTGIETPMYRSPEQRSADIERDAVLPPDVLRKNVRDSTAALAGDIDALPEPAWQNQVRTSRGRLVPATEVVWMRIREVAVHAVDLNVGIAFADLPPALNRALAADVISGRPDGEAAHLAQWLTGRTASAPTLSAWL